MSSDIGRRTRTDPIYIHRPITAAGSCSFTWSRHDSAVCDSLPSPAPPDGSGPWSHGGDLSPRYTRLCNRCLRQPARSRPCVGIAGCVGHTVLAPHLARLTACSGYARSFKRQPLRSYVLHRVQKLCESRSGRPGLPVLMSLTVSVGVKQH